MPDTVKIQKITGRNFEMEYFCFGTGAEPLVILPGASIRSVTLSADAIAESYRCFAGKYTVYVFSRETELVPGCSISVMADDTAEALKILGLKKVCLFGCSLGGMISQCIAARYPELVHALILASTAPCRTDTSRVVMENWCSLADSGKVRELNRSIASKVYSPAFYEKYRDIFFSLEGTGNPEELRRFSVLIRACLGFDAAEAAGAISCPTLVIGSWDDCVFSGEASVQLARSLHCPLYMYSGFGHAVYDEAPDYKARILAFFSEH